MLPLETLVALVAGVCILYRGIVILEAMGPYSSHYQRACWTLAVGGAIGLIFAPLANCSPLLPAMCIVVAFAGLSAVERRQPNAQRSQQHIHNGGNPHVS